MQEKKMMELERLKGKAEEACKRLQTDILSIKQQKVSAEHPGVPCRAGSIMAGCRRVAMERPTSWHALLGGAA